MRIRDFILSFDLGFSDLWEWKDESVRYKTFEEKNKDLGLLKEIILGDSIVNSFLGLEPIHPQPELWLESQTDLMASIYLTLGGYYRQAFICLRTWLEITLLGIYFSKWYKGKNSRYNQWKRGVRRSSSWGNLLNSSDKTRHHIDETVAHVLGLPDFGILRTLLAKEPVVALEPLS